MISIHHAVSRLRLRSLSAVELLQACLQTIEAADSEIHAWAMVDSERAIARAQAADAALAEGRAVRVLHGIPIGIKDIVDVHGLPTRAGSDFYTRRPRRHATIVERLTAAGAIIIGKTVSTPFACYDPPPTRNPYDSAHTPGGSSSGSAAAVAVGMCLGAVGTQTGGSISRPAAYCGVTGFKGTHGRVSVDGIVPVAPSLDHAGFLTSCVLDAAIMLQAVAGHDPYDPTSATEPVPDYSAGLLGEGRLRIGVLGAEFVDRADTDMVAAFAKARASLVGAADLEEIRFPADFDTIQAMHRRIMYSELAAQHGELFDTHAESVPPGLVAMVAEGRALSDKAVCEARAEQATFRIAVNSLLATVDALICPTAPTTAPRDLTTTGSPAFNVPWSFAGMPTAALPVDIGDDGMPTSVQLVGRTFGEAQLLRVAALVEGVLGGGAM